MPKLPNGKFQPLFAEGSTVRVVSPDPEITYLPVLPAQVGIPRRRAVTRVPINEEMVYRGVAWHPGATALEPYMLFDYTTTDKVTGESFVAKVMAGVATESLLQKVYRRP
jgi:hypothetical protein